MTVCIAALAKSGKKCCMAVDKMITANFPISYEYETDDVRKVYSLCDNICVLTAGDALAASTMIARVDKKHKIKETTDVQSVASIVLQEYVLYRSEIIEELHFRPRGLTIAAYYELQQKLQIGLVNLLDNQLASYDIGVSLIIVGYDKDNTKNCHLFTINNPGVLVCHDEIGFACTGSGAPHASYYLIGEKYKKSLDISNVKKLVRDAKKRSEVAPGVGDETKEETLEPPEDNTQTNNAK